MTMILIFPHLFELVQTLVTADGFGFLLQLQHERFVEESRAAVITGGRLVPAEIFQAGVAAKLVDSLIHCQLTCGLQKIRIKEQ